MRQVCEMSTLRRCLSAGLVLLLVAPVVLWCPWSSGEQVARAGTCGLDCPGRLARVSAGELVAVEKATALFEENLRALRVSELGLDKEVRGAGTIVAVVDTGVDPAHPAFNGSSAAMPKIIDWVDLTGEGLVDTRTVVRGKGHLLYTDYGLVKLGDVRSVSGSYHYGVFRENRIPRESPLMNKFAGVPGGGWVLVFVVDSKRAGVYDTVIVDANGNMDLSDDVPLKKFSESPGFSFFTKASTRIGAARLPFVVADVASDGTKVVLGFDANGHGTTVAGIIAASGRDGYRGIAPGASIVVIKAVGSDGSAPMERVMRAVRIAAAKGADVVNLSVADAGEVIVRRGTAGDGGLDVPDDSGGVQALVVAAVGNGGPGLGSARLPDLGSTGLFVGAGYTPGLLEAYGVGSTPKRGIFAFSAVGPSPRSGMVPSIIAPGIAAAPAPRWLFPMGYSIAEGTSIAAAHASGTALVVLGVVRQVGRVLSSVSLRSALLGGAQPEEGYLPVEQGYGFLDTPAAIQAARAVCSAMGEVKVLTLAGNPPSYRYGGLFRNDVPPGLSIHAIDNFGADPLELRLQATQGWVRPEQDVISIPPVKEREVRLKYDLVPGEGLHSALVVGRDLSGVPVVEIPVTYLRPTKLGDGTTGVQWVGEVEPGRWERHYVRVPDGATGLKVTLRAVRDGESGSAVIAYVISPGGQKGVTTVSPAQEFAETVAEFETAAPEPGVWEIVVYSPIPRKGVQAGSVDYELDVVCKGLFASSVVRTPEGFSRVTVRNSVGPLDVQALVAVRRASGYQGREVIWEISRGESLMCPLPEVKHGTVALVVEMKPIGDRSSECPDLDLYVYRYDSAARRWTEVGHSASKGSSGEKVCLAFPEPGDYVAYVEYAGGSSSACATAQFQLISQRLDRDDSSRVEAVRGAVLSQWKLGEEAQVDISSTGGETFLLMVRNNPVELLAVLPVANAADAGAVAWTVTSEPLVMGCRNQVTIRLWDKRRMTPLKGGVVLGGLYYPVVDGTVTLELLPQSEEVILDGAAECGASDVPLTIKLYAVKPDWGVVPMRGLDSSSDYVLRKVLSQMEAVTKR